MRERRRGQSLGETATHKTLLPYSSRGHLLPCRNQADVGPADSAILGPCHSQRSNDINTTRLEAERNARLPEERVWSRSRTRPEAFDEIENRHRRELTSSAPPWSAYIRESQYPRSSSKTVEISPLALTNLPTSFANFLKAYLDTVISARRRQPASAQGPCYARDSAARTEEDHLRQPEMHASAPPNITLSDPCNTSCGLASNMWKLTALATTGRLRRGPPMQAPFALEKRLRHKPSR